MLHFPSSSDWSYNNCCGCHVLHCVSVLPFIRFIRLSWFIYCVCAISKMPPQMLHSVAVYDAQEWTFTNIRLTLTRFSIRSENESIPAFTHAWISSTHKLLLTAVFPISTGIQFCRGNQEENDRENELVPLLLGVITAAVAPLPPTVHLCAVMYDFSAAILGLYSVNIM